MTKSRKLPGKPVRTRAADIKRFKELSELLFKKPLSDDGARAGALIQASMRTLQGELGPGHATLELIARNQPYEYAKNWAKEYLGLIERR